MADQLIANVIEIIDGAHFHRLELTELQQNLLEAKAQVTDSGQKTKQELKDHFMGLKKKLDEALELRLSELLSEVEELETESLQPLEECGDIIEQGISRAARVMEEGKQLLANKPENNVELLLKFKENPDCKTLNSLPEVPCLSDVPYISAEFPPSSVEKHLLESIEKEGKVIGRAPVQITDIEELPGSLLVKWSEVDEDSPVDVSEFCLQYSYGVIKSNDDSKATFHTAYTGPDTIHTVKHLRINTPYSFRVSCKGEGETMWGIWTVPKQAVTTIPHYEWAAGTDGYSTSNEGKTATRTGSSPGQTIVLYSKSQSYRCGHPITFKVLNLEERGQEDGVGIALSANNTSTLMREEAVFISAQGNVFVDGQEMKNRLPPLSKGLSLTVNTEMLANGRIRVSSSVKDKEVTFDWKVDASCPSSPVTGPGGGPKVRFLYFATSSAKEEWKISVE